MYEEGETIVREGEVSREMYVIQEGRALVTKKAGEGELVLRTLQKGDFFGEMALLESEPRSATVRAAERTKVLVIHSGGFLLKIRRDPTFAFEMLQKLSGRVRSISDKLTDALGDEPKKVERANRLIAETEFSSRQERAHED